MTKHALIYIIGVFLLAACQRIEMPTKDAGTSKGDMQHLEGDTLTVAAFRQAEEGTSVFLKGYVVGYIDDTSISNATFGIPKEKNNTNMLLADEIEETEPYACVPVAISTDLRTELGLFSHPEHYRMPILVYGKVETYFRVNGIKNIVGYQWITNEEMNPNGSYITIDILHTAPAPFEGR